MNERTKAIALKLSGGPYDGLPTVVWWLWASTSVNRIANFAVPFCTLYLTASRGKSESVAGVLIGLYGIGAVAGSVGGGAAADWFGGKRTLVATYAAAAVSTMALGLGSRTLTLAVCMVCVGVFSGAARPATNALIAYFAPGEHRVKVFALNYWSMNLGFAVGCVCAGLVADSSFVLLFWIDGLTTIACAIMIFLRVAATPPTRIAAPMIRAFWRRAARDGEEFVPFRDRTFAAVVLMSVVTAALLQQLTVTLPLSMRASGHSSTAYGAVAALNGVLVCSLQMPVSSLVTKRPLMLSMAIGSALIAAGFGLTMFAVSVLGYAATLVVWTLGEIVLAPTAPALAALLASDTKQGKYQGALTGAWSLGAVAGPVVGTWIIARHGTIALWGACGGAGAVVTLGYALLYKLKAPRLNVSGDRDPGRVPL